MTKYFCDTDIPKGSIVFREIRVWHRGATTQEITYGSLDTSGRRVWKNYTMPGGRRYSSYEYDLAIRKPKI